MGRRFGVDDRVARRDEFREVLKEEAKEYEGFVPANRPEPSPEEEPEYSSIESFASYLVDEADDAGNVPPFTLEQVEKLSHRLQITSIKVMEELKGCGLVLAKREPAKEVRGYRSSSNPYAGNPMCATTGHDQITGFAGHVG